jgi:hypothetical protein
LTYPDCCCNTDCPGGEICAGVPGDCQLGNTGTCVPECDCGGSCYLPDCYECSLIGYDCIFVGEACVDYPYGDCGNGYGYGGYGYGYGYSCEEPGIPGGEIPEFSVTTLILMVVIIGLGVTLIMKRKKA